jgi:hypothetical protein
MAVVRLNRDDLPRIIRNIEANGGDASELRSIMEGLPAARGRRSEPAEVSDDELVEMIRSESTVEEGESLECLICHDESKRLTSGACDGCFRQWALSCKDSFLATRRQHGSTDNG